MTTTIDTQQTFVLAVTSGKGGAGKSVTSVNIALMLQKMGFSTALIDVDIGMSNCATMLNQPSTSSVGEWINGNCFLEDLISSYEGLTLVTGSDDPRQKQFGSELMMDALDQVTEYLSKNHQFIILDTPAGAGEMTLWALDNANLAIVLLIDEPTAISDVYRLCKYIYSLDPEYPFASIVNFAENESSAENINQRFNTILNYFLNKKIRYLGFIPADEKIRKSVQKQIPLVIGDPHSSLFREFEFISQNILGQTHKSFTKLTETTY